MLGKETTRAADARGVLDAIPRGPRVGRHNTVELGEVEGGQGRRRHGHGDAGVAVEESIKYRG